MTRSEPTRHPHDTYEASFYEDRAEFIRRDRALTTTLEVVVSPEDDAEVRQFGRLLAPS